MKLRTNLTPSELAVVGEGLKHLAKAQTEDKQEIVLENNAEKELMRRADGLFDRMSTSLQDEIAEVLRRTS